MHERTQRAIARMTFVFCCALPTLAVVVFILLTWTPWWHAGELASIEQHLSDRVDMRIKVDDFKRSSPTTLELSDVKVFDPESKQLVAKVHRVEWSGRGDETSIVLQQPELQSAELAGVWKLIHDRFLCRPDQTGDSVRVAVKDLTIHSLIRPLPLTYVDAWVRPSIDGKGIEATIQCYAADRNLTGDSQPIDISIVRQREPEPTTTWKLNTTTPLPCSALAEFFPDIEMLGDDAEFVGSMQWTITPSGWSIDLAGGEFRHLALSRWFQPLSHKLTASDAAVHFDRCHIAIEEGETTICDVAGTLRARNGQVGPSLLRAAHEHFGFAVVDTDRGTAYDRLALGFNFTGPLMRLDGICRTERGYEGLHAGVVMVADGHPLAESGNRWLQAVQLQTALAPRHSVMVPVSRQTTSLMQLLIPPSRQAPEEAQPVPYISSTRRLDGEPTITQPKQ